METDYFDKNAAQWDSSDKQLQARAVYARMREVMRPDGAGLVLDFGCGTGLLGFQFAEDFEALHFADTSEGMLNIVRKKALEAGIKNYQAFNPADETALSTYRAVVSLLALHHIEDISALLNQLHAHITQDGYLALADLDPEDGSFHAPMQVPHNGIDRNCILNFMNASGYQILCNETVYTNIRHIDGERKEYPIFLIVGGQGRRENWTRRT